MLIWVTLVSWFNTYRAKVIEFLSQGVKHLDPFVGVRGYIAPPCLLMPSERHVFVEAFFLWGVVS